MQQTDQKYPKISRASVLKTLITVRVVQTPRKSCRPIKMNGSWFFLNPPLILLNSEELQSPTCISEVNL